MGDVLPEPEQGEGAVGLEAGGQVEQGAPRNPVAGESEQVERLLVAADDPAVDAEEDSGNYVGYLECNAACNTAANWQGGPLNFEFLTADRVFGYVMRLDSSGHPRIAVYRDSDGTQFWKRAVELAPRASGTEYAKRLELGRARFGRPMNCREVTQERSIEKQD